MGVYRLGSRSASVVIRYIEESAISEILDAILEQVSTAAAKAKVFQDAIAQALSNQFFSPEMLATR